MQIDYEFGLITLSKDEHGRFNSDMQYRHKILQKAHDLSDESEGRTVSIYAEDAEKQIAHVSCETLDEKNPETYLD
ncbi:MAG: hypothetical protein M1570_09590 [Chloroflexi bacterium]|nr:hypothetical protein [Chloroflexota bacterium]